MSGESTVEALRFWCPRQSPEVLSLLVRRCRYRLREFVVNWFTRYVFGFHVNKWLWLVVVILASFALCIASLRLALWLLTRKRDKDESDYWRIHGG